MRAEPLSHGSAPRGTRLGLTALSKFSDCVNYIDYRTFRTGRLAAVERAWVARGATGRYDCYG
jgi:hypothetical protein